MLYVLYLLLLFILFLKLYFDYGFTYEIGTLDLIIDWCITQKVLPLHLELRMERVPGISPGGPLGFSKGPSLGGGAWLAHGLAVWGQICRCWRGGGRWHCSSYYLSPWALMGNFVEHGIFICEKMWFQYLAGIMFTWWSRQVFLIWAWWFSSLQVCFGSAWSDCIFLQLSFKWER